MTRDDWGTISAEVTKQRDGPTGGHFDYTLRQVELGLDQDGDPVTTCLVEPAQPAEAGRVVSGPASKMLDILKTMIADRGKVLNKPHFPTSACVDFNEWRDECIKNGRLVNSPDSESHKREFRRQRNVMENGKHIIVKDNYVWLAEK